MIQEEPAAWPDTRQLALGIDAAASASPFKTPLEWLSAERDGRRSERREIAAAVAALIKYGPFKRPLHTTYNRTLRLVLRLIEARA